MDTCLANIHDLSSHISILVMKLSLIFVFLIFTVILTCFTTPSMVTVTCLTLDGTQADLFSTPSTLELDMVSHCIVNI